MWVKQAVTYKQCCPLVINGVTGVALSFRVDGRLAHVATVAGHDCIIDCVTQTLCITAVDVTGAPVIAWRVNAAWTQNLASVPYPSTFTLAGAIWPAISVAIAGVLRTTFALDAACGAKEPVIAHTSSGVVTDTVTGARNAMNCRAQNIARRPAPSGVAVAKARVCAFAVREACD